MEFGLLEWGGIWVVSGGGESRPGGQAAQVVWDMGWSAGAAALCGAAGAFRLVALILRLVAPVRLAPVPCRYGQKHQEVPGTAGAARHC
ncbi:hypothetical protein ACFS32_19945 [Novosphingobium pokkalii]|uniref:hypothetical protein n=1 Tax=Novosphingobium pokkalii TaxID=1770194 RepID=UPI001748A4AE